MSALSTITTVNQQIIDNIPHVVQFVQAFGQDATGPEKQSAAVRTLTGIEVVSGDLTTHPNPIVAQVAILVNFAVFLAKLFKKPGFTAVAATPGN